MKTPRFTIAAPAAFSGVTPGQAPASKKRTCSHSRDSWGIAQDNIATEVGIYDASASLHSPGPWIMQLIAFRAAGSPVAPPNPEP